MTRQRTEQQNRSLHLFFRNVAGALNAAGLDVRTTLSMGWEIPWTDIMVKEMLWRPLQVIQLAKNSTTELETKDIDLIYSVINEFLASHGIHEEWPSVEAMITEYDEKKVERNGQISKKQKS